MSDSTIDVADVRLRYRFDGPAQAPVLVMLNSLGCLLSMWDRQIPALTQRFRVLRFDTRGHGQSSIGTAPYTIDRVGRDVVDLLDALAIDRAHFCGLSMGGMVGMWLGIHAPHRAHRIALCNTAAKIGTPERWNARIEAIRAGGMAAVVDAIIKIWFTEGFLAREPAAVAEIRQQLDHANAQGYVAACAAIRDMDQREAIAAIKLPTLVIAGTHDGSTPPAEGRFIAERITGARYVELDAAHLSNIEAAAPFNAALVEFFEG
jgi:3-oxoadipate enol-lactonase